MGKDMEDSEGGTEIGTRKAHTEGIGKWEGQVGGMNVIESAPPAIVMWMLSIIKPSILNQNAGAALQPSSLIPAGNGVGDGGTLLSLYQLAMGQPASLSDHSAFQPVDSLGLIPNQPRDLGAQPAI